MSIVHLKIDEFLTGLSSFLVSQRRIVLPFVRGDVGITWLGMRPLDIDFPPSKVEM